MNKTIIQVRSTRLLHVYEQGYRFEYNFVLVTPHIFKDVFQSLFNEHDHILIRSTQLLLVYQQDRGFPTGHSP